MPLPIEPLELPTRDYEKNKKLTQASRRDIMGDLIDAIDGKPLPEAIVKIAEILENEINSRWAVQTVNYNSGDEYNSGGFEILNYKYETEDEYT